MNRLVRRYRSLRLFCYPIRAKRQSKPSVFLFHQFRLPPRLRWRSSRPGCWQRFCKIPMPCPGSQFFLLNSSRLKCLRADEPMMKFSTKLDRICLSYGFNFCIFDTSSISRFCEKFNNLPKAFSSKGEHLVLKWWNLISLNPSLDMSWEVSILKSSVMIVAEPLFFSSLEIVGLKSYMTNLVTCS